jgi:hypothetical protein
VRFLYDGIDRASALPSRARCHVQRREERPTDEMIGGMFVD